MRTSAAPSQRVLIPRLGWRSGPWACRSLRRAGFEVITGEDEGRVSNRTRFSSELVRHPPVSEDPERFVDWAIDISKRRRLAAVLPLDDEVVHLLSGHFPTEASNTALVGPTPDQYRRLCDKAALAEIGSRAGFIQPPQVLVLDAAQTTGLPALPNMVKPRTPGMASADGLVTVKPILVSTEEERSRAIGDLVARVGEALVEGRVEGIPWRVHFVRTRTGIATLNLRTVRSYPPTTGQSSVQRVTYTRPDLNEAVGALLAEVEYLGPGSAQVIETAHGYFVHDVNLRLPVSVGATIAGGLDMPRLAVEAALGKDVSHEVIPNTRVTYISLLAELQQLRDGLRRRGGSASPGRVALDILTAATRPGGIIDPLNVRDPLPIFLGVAEVARRNVPLPGTRRARSGLLRRSKA
jgi:predicted ATP-grasp superfamily ATP-dependent carboligase